MAHASKVHLKLIHTSDVHGNFFLWDYVNERPVRGSLARVYAYVESLRKSFGNRLILMDGGDVMQGTPVVYYSNTVAPGDKSFSAEIMNYMRYDVGTIGNHDIETGHRVYDSWVRDCNFPIIGANVLDKNTGQPYLRPYTIIERCGVRIAVLGMTTPAVPNWLSPDLWSGLEFDDMVYCAEKWMKIIREKEHPDVVIGLFHSGKEGGIITDEYIENAALDVARKVPGFDLVCYGHDHARNVERITACDGREVVCCAPAGLATVVDEIDIVIRIKDDVKSILSIDAKIVDLSYYKAQETHYFHRYFKRHLRNTEYYVQQKIGSFTRTISSEDAYFGSSAFVDLIHRAQLEETGAQVSLAPPLSFSAQIKAGDVCVRDMFNLYSHENTLYTLRFTGREIKGILEMSYGFWVTQMKTTDDHIMQIDYVLEGGKRLGFKNLAYNFDSAAGICYEVDVTKPYGEKVNILCLSDGTPFDMDMTYTVTTNSYRGNGGGELLTKGAGITHKELLNRLLRSTELDLRHYLIKYIQDRGVIDPQPLGHWKFVPEEWAAPACARDRELLFGFRHKEEEK